MNNTFTLKKNGKAVAKDVINLTLNTSSYTENNKKFDYAVLNGEEKVITFEGIQIFFGEVSTNGLINFDVIYDTPFVLLTFEIEGGHGFKTKDSDLPLLEMISNTCNCSFIPSFNGSMFYTSEKRKYFTCIFSKDFVSNLLKFHFPRVGKPYLNLIKRNKHFNLFSESKKIPITVHNILNEIINCYYEGDIKEAFLRTKITEIFVELLAEFNKKSKNSLSENDILAEETKDFILKNFAAKITLDDISKELTTNKTKLKIVFKNRFNTSIFAFKTKVQMTEAKKMFHVKQFTIAEVAYRVGYKNPQHFTTAFKKQFDITPSHYLKSI